jgi:hypothetical protein
MSILDLYSRSFLNNAKTNELYNPTGFFDVQSSATYAGFLDTPAYFNYDISSAESERDSKLLELAETTGFNLIEENRFNTENDLQGRTILPSDSEKEELYKKNLDESIIAQREAAPNIWQGIKTNQEILDEIAEKRNLAEDILSVKTEQAEGFAARYIAPLTGGLAAGMVDPVNIATLPLGIGAFGTGFKAFLQTAGANALLNMGVETSLLPEYAKMREVVGRPVTSGEMAAQVALSGAATFGLMGLAKGIEVAAPKVKSALANAPSVINTTSRSFRKKRKAAISELETIINTSEVPISIKQEAKETLREVETVLDYPPQLEETIARQYEDTGRLYDDNATIDAIESDAITLHKEALLETATALSEGKKPSYNPLLLETDIPYRNFYTPPQIEVDRYVAHLRSQQPDFEAALKQTRKKTLKAQIGYNPIRLNQFLKQKGGIANFNGELETRGLNTSNSIGLVREKYKKRRDGTYDININNRNSVGNVGTSFDWDRQKQLAFDAGYFPEFDSADAITMSAFFDKIAEDRFRQPVYDAEAIRDIENYNNQFPDIEASQFAYESEKLALASEYGISTNGTFDEINNAIFEYEAIQALQQKYAKQNDFINKKADKVYQSLLRIGFSEQASLAQHAFFTSTMHAFLRNYGVIASDIENIINDYFSRLNISRGDTAMQQDIRFAPEDFDTLQQRKQTSNTQTPSLEGFEPISQRELIERKMEGASKAKVAQKGMTGETNLFDQSELAQDTLFQGQTKGAISFAERNSFIQMFEGADVSTFIHEMGHFNMRIMHDIANSPNATQSLIDDYNVLRNFVDAEENVRFNVEQEEKIARAFELYVREGKAPSEGLKGVFYKLATWLREIYRKVSDLDVTINDELRQVFDKWVAPVEAAPVNTFVDTPASFKPILDDVQFEPNAVMDANMAEFMRLVKDLPDEKIFMDNGVEISYANIMQEIENDNAYLAAINTCAR